MNNLSAKNNLVKELFVRTADENYITARWCAINEFDTDFLWLAVHSFEKYFKAVLLLNGQTARGYGHDIVELYKGVRPVVGALIPDRLERPTTLDIDHWFDRSVEEFMAHLFRNGNADNRYLLYGYVTRSQDLHMLDQMVFYVRRVVCELDGRVFPTTDARAPTFTHRERLSRNPEYSATLHMPLDNLIEGSGSADARFAALNLNAAFAPDDFVHTPSRVRSASRNPVIVRRIFETARSMNPKAAREGIEVAEWLLANVQLPRSLQSEIANELQAARTRHGL